jgi:hypothetical protein
MQSASRRNLRTTILVAALLGVAFAPLRVRALGLAVGELTLPSTQEPDLAVAAAATYAAEGPSLDFELLPEPPPVAANPVDGSLGLRRRMLRFHQGLGLGLLGLQLATTTVGQLNYSDRFGVDSTARYQLSHAALAYSTLGVFAVNGAVALLAPRPPAKRSQGFDRVTLHKLGMLGAALGMAAQGAVGIYTREREGYLNQEYYARVHLVIGYATLAAVGVAVGALVL